MLSDRRLCLALDEPQLCNGHMGVRRGKRNMKMWGVCYLLKGVMGRQAARQLGLEEKGQR